VLASSLPSQLKAVGVHIREVPAHDRRYTLGEAALAEVLADPQTGDVDSPRVRHDIDCVAAVLTQRRGVSRNSFEESSAVFCTTSGGVIKGVQTWYREQGERGVPPIVHQYALTSLAWLKRPKAARGVKLHEIAAL